MKITVTAEHIKKGKRCSPYECPVALACIDAGFKDVSIGTSGCNLDRERFLYIGNVRSNIDRFDAGSPIKPFEFEILKVEEQF